MIGNKVGTAGSSGESFVGPSKLSNKSDCFEVGEGVVSCSFKRYGEHIYIYYITLYYIMLYYIFFIKIYYIMI